MNEQRRTAYLEAMGIDTFVPRWRLPAAAESVQAPLPEPAPEQPQAAEIPLQQPTRESSSSPAKVGGVVSGIIGELAGETSSRAQPSAQGAEPSSPAKRVLDVLEKPAAEDAVRFTLSLWRVSERVLVIDSHQAKQGLPTGALLSNILFAKGLRSPLPRSEVLAWPLVGSAIGESGWPHAAEMVQAFLTARCERQPVQSIWLMGEAAFRAVFAGADDYFEHVGNARALSSLGASALVLPSLAEILKSPAVKADVWQAIKELEVV